MKIFALYQQVYISPLSATSASFFSIWRFILCFSLGLDLERVKGYLSMISMNINKYWILFTLFWFYLCFPCVSAPWSWLWQEHGKTTSPPPRKLLRTSSGLCFLFWNHDLCCLSCSSLPDHSAWPQSCSCPVFSWPLLWSSSSDRVTLFSWSETIPAPDTLDTSGPELTDIYEMIPDYSLRMMMMRQWNLCCLKYHYILRQKILWRHVI